MKHLLLTSLFLFCSLGLIAQESHPIKNNVDTLRSAFQIISKREKPGGAVVNFHQDKRIEKVVTFTNTSLSATTQGYRVQVFSSNAQRTARQEAFTYESNIKEAFPAMKIYVSYSSPFWKVRIGDFTTQLEARRFTEQLLLKFPELKGETYTVRDHISVPSK